MRFISSKNLDLSTKKDVMDGVASDGKIAELIVNGNLDYDNDTIYAPICTLTDEPFDLCLRKEDIEDKDVLTATGSGDYLFWIMLNNPASVSTFDINIFNEYYQVLKFGALLKLDYNDYLNFFYGENAFSKDEYAKLESALPKNVKEFWGNLVNKFDSSEITNSKLFDQNRSDVVLARFRNPFLKSEIKYLEAKKAMYQSLYVFHNLALNELNQINKKFDTIFLGNIEKQNSFKVLITAEKLKEQLKSNLTRDGVIMSTTCFDNYSPVDPKYNVSVKKLSLTSYGVKISIWQN